MPDHERCACRRTCHRQPLPSASRPLRGFRLPTSARRTKAPAGLRTRCIGANPGDRQRPAGRPCATALALLSITAGCVIRAAPWQVSTPNARAYPLGPASPCRHCSSAICPLWLMALGQPRALGAGSASWRSTGSAAPVVLGERYDAMSEKVEDAGGRAYGGILTKLPPASGKSCLHEARWPVPRSTLPLTAAYRRELETHCCRAWRISSADPRQISCRIANRQQPAAYPMLNLARAAMAHISG